MSLEWSAGERLLLVHAVEHFGPHAWAEIAEAVRVTAGVMSEHKQRPLAFYSADNCKELYEQLSLEHENLDAHAAQLSARFLDDLRRRVALLDVDAAALHAQLAVAPEPRPVSPPTVVVTEAAAAAESAPVDIDTDEPPPQQQAPIVTTPAARRVRRRSGEDAAPTSSRGTSRGTSRVASRAASPSLSPLAAPPDESPVAAESVVVAAAAEEPQQQQPAPVVVKRSTPHRAAAPQSDPLAQIIRTLMHDERARWFVDPVDESVAGKYNEVIREPLHLRAIAVALEHAPQLSAEHVWAALLHVFYNAFVFNDPASEVFQHAHELRCIAAKLILPHLPAPAAEYARALASLSPVHTADGQVVELRMPKVASSGATAKRKR